MKRIDWLGWALTGLLALALAGCGGGDDAASTGGGSAKSSKTAKKIDNSKPDAIFLTMADAVEENEPGRAWAALPQQWRSDADGLISEFAGKMDAEIWEKGTGIVGKVATLVKSKHEMLLQNPMVAPMLAQAGTTTEDIEKHIDGVADAVTSLTRKISSLDSLEKMSVESLLADTSGLVKMLKDVAPVEEGSSTAAMLRSVKTTVLSESGDTARVRIEADGARTEEYDMKKVDGIWLPVDMIESWRTGIEEARSQLASLEIPADEKPRMMQMMSMIDVTLDQLIAAKTDAEFQQAIMGAMATVAPMMMGGGGGGPMGGGMPGGFPPPNR